MAASAMPTTGPGAISRAATRPGSPKQAITWPSACSPPVISASRPGTLRASSYCDSIEAGPIRDVTATVLVSVPAAAAALAPIIRVIDSVVFGLTSLMSMARLLGFRDDDGCRGDGRGDRAGDQVVGQEAEAAADEPAVLRQPGQHVGHLRHDHRGQGDEAGDRDGLDRGRVVALAVVVRAVL